MNKDFVLTVDFFIQANIQKAGELEADLRNTIDQLEKEIKARDAEMDKERLTHQVSDTGRCC